MIVHDYNWKRKVLGKEIIRHLNKIKYLYSPEYERYWQSYIAPLLDEKEMKIETEMKKQISYIRNVSYSSRYLDDLLKKEEHPIDPDTSIFFIKMKNYLVQEIWKKDQEI